MVYERRPASAVAEEERYLKRRLEEIEAGMGAVAARLEAPTPAVPQVQALDRARQLTAELLRQIRVRTLDEAIAARLDWLERAAVRRTQEVTEPLPELGLIDLDRRLLTDLLAAWQREKR